MTKSDLTVETKKRKKSETGVFPFSYGFFFAFLLLPICVYSEKQSSHYYLTALFEFVMWIDATCETMKRFAPVISVDANNLLEAVREQWMDPALNM